MGARSGGARTAAKWQLSGSPDRNPAAAEGSTHAAAGASTRSPGKRTRTEQGQRAHSGGWSLGAGGAAIKRVLIDQVPPGLSDPLLRMPKPAFIFLALALFDKVIMR
jgi:hypothetical protein